MGKIEECTAKLIEAVKESREYRHFCELRDEVAKDPELRRQINDFRRHVFETQNSGDSTDAYAEMERISREYEEFRRNPLVDGFLKSELRVCRMIQQVNIELISAVDLDTKDVTEKLTV